MDRDRHERWLDRLIAIGLVVLVVGIAVTVLATMFT
jgi:hypothetical protein